VIEAAIELRKRLEGFGLTGFCKTTGGKGLHVVTALTPDTKSPDWWAAKTFAREVCRRLAADHPDRFLERKKGHAVAEAKPKTKTRVA
jgi:bifunctional non-homologous end joining protein LigD